MSAPSAESERKTGPAVPVATSGGDAAADADTGAVAAAGAGSGDGAACGGGFGVHAAGSFSPKPPPSRRTLDFSPISGTRFSSTPLRFRRPLNQLSLRIATQ